MGRCTYSGLVHLNGSLLCAIDCETSGLIAGQHDLLEIAILPLDENLNVHKSVTPFHIELQPKRPDNVDPDAMKVNKRRIEEFILNGIDPWKAADLFEEWFERLNLGYRKYISPLAQNWPFDRSFIFDWLGPKTFEHCFCRYYRDTMVCALFENDNADARNEPAPYPKVNLQYLASQLKVETDRAHEAMHDCLTTAEVYKRLITSRF